MPEVPPPSPANPPEPVSPPSAGSGLPQNVAAGLACLFTIVGGVVFLVLEPRNRFVRFASMQAIVLGTLAIAVHVVFRIAGGIFSFIPLAGKLLLVLLGLVNLLFGLAWFVAYVVTVVQAFTNHEWELPWLGKLARRLLLRFDGAPPKS